MIALTHMNLTDGKFVKFLMRN